MNESPLKVTKATKERVAASAEELFGERCWVRDKDGRLVERHGALQPGDERTLQSFRDCPPRFGQR